MNQSRAMVCFKGRVQGVWFRAYTKQQADQHHVYGWVRNLADGRVEALFEGTEVAVKVVIIACKEGPASARVEETELSWQPATGEFSQFEVLG